MMLQFLRLNACHTHLQIIERSGMSKRNKFGAMSQIFAPIRWCAYWFEIIESRSIVNDVEVGIARTKIGEMYAEFIYESVGFQIYTSGLAQDEFVAVIESILK